MMTRREMLVRVFGVAVAATVAPLVDLTDLTPMFWDQAPIRRVWRIIFPDGMVFSFGARVVAEKITVDGTVSLTLRSEGPITASRTTSSMAFDHHGAPIELARLPSPSAPATVLEMGDGKFVEIQDIALPKLTRSEGYVRGLKRTGDLTFTISPFSGEK